ncbi:MAG: calcium-binding protein [Inquilinus sp.]|uniref:calcium-binding protein n=1 Tax=Inquilinus sp. TaxID=1932117 RepID=UPI003F352427
MYVNLTGTAGNDSFKLDFSNLDPADSPYENRYVVNGGSGTDTVDFSRLPPDLQFMTGLVGYNPYPGEQLWQAIYSNDVDGKRITFELYSVETFIGSAGNDGIEGDFDATVPTTMFGMAGNDLLVGSQGGDRAYGGIGDDALYGSGGDDRLVGDAGRDAISGGSGADSIDGGADNDSVWGGDDDDAIYGGTSDDILRGEDGNDILEGAAGADTLTGGVGIDTAGYAGSSTGVIVNLATGRGYSGDAMGDTLSGLEQVLGSEHADQLAGDVGDNVLWGRGGDDALSGAEGADTLKGGAGADALYGGAGSDQLYGEDGNDLLYGGPGADRFDGGAGIDTASYERAAAGVTVELRVVPHNTGEAAGDVLTSVEQIIGSNFADRITGDSSKNTLWGGAGNDVLQGGMSADVLRGGSGADRFVYTDKFDSLTAAIYRDLIADFSAAQGDKIDVSPIESDGNYATTDNGFSFGTGAFTGKGGELRVVTSGGYQVVYGDIAGDKQPDFAIAVIADHALRASDFVL